MAAAPPILFSLPRVHTYGVALLLAGGVGWWLARRRARGFGIPVWRIDWLAPALLVGAAVGTRLAGRFSQMLSDGGGNDNVLYGGLLMAVGVGAVYGAALRIPLGQLADAFACSLPLGIAVLRVGCCLAGCCWGDLCVSPEHLASVSDQAWLRQVQTIPGACGEDWPLRVSFPAGSPAYYQHLTAGVLSPNAERSLPVHPVQLYETAASLGLLGVLLMVDRRLRRWGESFLWFGFGYSVIRFVLEWFRADNPHLAWGLTFSQWAAAGCASACVLVWGVRAVLAKRQTGPGVRRSSSCRIRPL